MAWVIAAIVLVAVAVRQLAEHRYSTSANRDAAMAVIDPLVTGLGLAAVGVVFLVAREFGAALAMAVPGAAFVAAGASIARLQRSSIFRDDCDAHLFHQDYERCTYCGGTRARETAPVPAQKSRPGRVLLYVLVVIALPAAAGALRSDTAPLNPEQMLDPNYTLDLVKEDIPSVIKTQLGEEATSCEIDHIDRFVCTVDSAQYCYRFDIGATGEQDLRRGLTHYRDYDVRYLMIPVTPNPPDASLYLGTPYRCRTT